MAIARTGLILTTFLALLSAFVWGENEISRSFQDCISKESTRLVIITQAVCTARLAEAYNGLIATFAGLAVAAFTFTLWRSTEKLWKASLDQAGITERIGTAQVRAYVNVPKAEVGFLNMGVGWQPEIGVIFKNNGSSPARALGWNPAIRFAIGGRRRTRSLTNETDPKKWARTHAIAASDEIGEHAIISDMFIERFAPSGVPPVVILQIRFIYMDVFDREVEDDAYFIGLADRSIRDGAQHWSVSVSPCPKPNDWDQADTE